MKYDVKVLIVKGDKFQAAKAAADHGVPFVFMDEITGRSTLGSTTVDVDTLNNWFCETIEAPYPAGTLLWWGERRTEQRKEEL